MSLLCGRRDLVRRNIVACKIVVDELVVNDGGLFSTLTTDPDALGLSLVSPENMPETHVLRGLRAGSNMTLSVVGDDVVFDAAGGGGSVPFSKEAGALGLSIVGPNSSSTNHLVRGLLAGTRMSLGFVGDDVEFNSTGVPLSLEGVGTSPIASTSTDTNHRMRGFLDGTNVTLAVVGEDIEISASVPLSLAGVGTSPIASTSTDANHEVRGFLEGSNVTLAVVGEDIEISASGGGSGSGPEVASGYLFLTSSQNSSGTFAKLLISSVHYDVGGVTDAPNSQFVIPVDGAYLVTIRGSMSGSESGSARVLVNGAIPPAIFVQIPTTADFGDVLWQTTEPLVLSIGDVLEYQLEADVSPRTVVPGARSTYMAIHYQTPV